MSQFLDLRTFLESNQEQFAQAVEKKKDFREELANLQSYWDSSDTDEGKLEATLSVMQKYPPVWKAMIEAGLATGNGALLAEAPVTSPKDSAHATPKLSEDGHKPSPQSESNPALLDGSVPSAPSLVSVSEMKPQVPQASGEKTMAKTTSTTSTKDSLALWDKKMAIGKEVVTGLLGVLIVLATLGIATRAAFIVADQEAWSRTTDILVILNGLVGVVLGYYFGRMPGEARADKAEAEANTAQSELDQKKAEVRGLLIDSEVARSRGTTAGGITLTPEKAERLWALVND